ncbi:hypothetical protein SLA2020_302130 [Shorea laevis]
MAYDCQQATSAQIRSEEPRSKATATAKTAETNDGEIEPAPAVGVGAGASAARAKPNRAKTARNTAISVALQRAMVVEILKSSEGDTEPVSIRESFSLCRVEKDVKR